MAQGLLAKKREIMSLCRTLPKVMNMLEASFRGAYAPVGEGGAVHPVAETLHKRFKWTLNLWVDPWLNAKKRGEHLIICTPPLRTAPFPADPFPDWEWTPKGTCYPDNGTGGKICCGGKT